MLQLVLGTAGTGKTTYINNKITSYAENQEKCLFIVPEQFSKTMESTIFSGLSKGSLSMVDVFSFTSLIRDVQSKHTGFDDTVLSVAGKAVMAKRAIDNVSSMLNTYSKQKDNLLFSYMLSETFDEFKRSGLDGSTLFNISKKAPDSNEKLKEVSLIYAEYCGLMQDKFCDQEDSLLKLSNSLPLSYTFNTHVFIDSFESFSYGQLCVIQNFIKNAKSVTITLTADKVFDDSFGTGNFSFTQKTAGQLLTLAKKEQAKVLAPIILEKTFRFETDSTLNVDNFLMGKPLKNKTINDVTATLFENQYKEVSFVAAKIRQLISQGYCYNDIAVICPQLDIYENQLQESFALAGIPEFIDQNRIITSSVPVLLFKSIFSVMSKGLTAKTILPLLQTRLTNFDDDDINALENYLYIWQDYKFDLEKDFDLPIGGLQANLTLEDIAQLDKFNYIKNSILNILNSENIGKGMQTGANLLNAAYNISQKLGCNDKLTKLIQDLGSTDKEYADLILRQWDSVIETLEELYTITIDDVLKPKDMESLFMLMISGVEIGFAPQTQDCVMITQPSRMKLEAVKVAFIIGAAQDIFPGIVGTSGVISSADRDFLKANDYPLKSDFDNLYSFENLYFYKALTTASHKLFISCAQKNLNTKQFFSAEIENLKQGLNLKADSLSLEDYCITKGFFTEFAGENITQPTRKSYLHLLSELDINPPICLEKSFEIADIEYLNAIIGNTITISPTGAESYFQCAFTYFLQRLLRLKPLEKVQLTARQAGEYLHFVAQKVMEQYGKDFYKAAWEDITKTIDKAVNNYITDNYPPQIATSPQFEAQHINMQQNATYFLQHIYQEQNSASFRPIAFEQKIGLEDGIPPLTIAYEDKKVNIIGVCDRVDLMENDGDNYLRIVDYKTGTKSFSLDDVYNGLSSQLLLYMSALLENRFLNLTNLKPAAVLYQQADTEFKFDKDTDELYKAVGMAVKDKSISYGFDNTYKGRFGVIKGEDKVDKITGSEAVEPEIFDTVLNAAKDNISLMANGVYNGNFNCLPLEKDGHKPCSWCNFKVICQNNDKSRQALKNNFKEKKDGE